MTKAKNPGVGRGIGGGRPSRQDSPIQVRLSLPAQVVEELERRSLLAGLPMWRIVADLVVSQPEEPPSPCALSLDLLVSECCRLEKDSVGMAFIPELVQAVQELTGEDAPAIHEALRAAYQAQKIELRPESGLNRLSPEELARCIPGPRGSKLSWARLMSR